MTERHDTSVTDGLEPLRPLDPAEANTASELLTAMAQTAFGGRRLGEAADVLEAMVKDPDCKVVLTLSGAMTVAKMGKVIIRMIEAGMVHCIISTGALMSHGLSEGIGLDHFKVDPNMTDEEMFAKGMNRVYDTLELEANLDGVELFVRKTLNKYHQHVIGGNEEFFHQSSSGICHILGKELAEQDVPSVLGAAYTHGVPVFIPAFTDSEMGLDVATWQMQQRNKGVVPMSSVDEALADKCIPIFNPYKDLFKYTQWCLKAKKLGIFTIGGGVPRNWAQQVSPFRDLIGHRVLDSVTPKEELPRFQYAIRICPEPTHWGGLSGCTYSEGVSWGKFVPVAEGGKFAEVYCDATIAWPLLIRGVLERL